ncbi:MAG: excinuclease ABC subunit C, partial [Planctomycetota bacterium]
MSGSWIQQIPTLPLEPGVYIFYGKNDEVLYVGKSKCLRKRVKNYADLKGDSRPFIPHLHEEAHRLEFLVTDTEKEALLLENQLIVKLNPKYNILFRQDTTYISIKITIKHPFPRLMLTRQVKKDGALYFGPYTSGKALRETLHFIKSFFRIRTCSNSEFKRRKRACLLYQIDRCTAPCVGKVSEKEYKKKVEDLVRFLQGKNRIILDELEKKMARASEKLDFERAIKYRDQIKALEATLEKQKVLSLDQKDYDVVAIFQKDGKAAIQMLFIRGGKLLTSHAKLVTSWEKPETLLGSFLKHYYLSNVYIPQE